MGMRPRACGGLLGGGHGVWGQWGWAIIEWGVVAGVVPCAGDGPLRHGAGDARLVAVQLCVQPCRGGLGGVCKPHAAGVWGAVGEWLPEHVDHVGVVAGVVLDEHEHGGECGGQLHVAVCVEAFGGQVVVRVQACAAHPVRQCDHLLGGVLVGCACVEQHARLPVCMPSFEHGEQAGEVDRVDTGVVQVHQMEQFVAPWGALHHGRGGGVWVGWRGHGGRGCVPWCSPRLPCGTLEGLVFVWLPKEQCGS